MGRHGFVRVCLLVKWMRTPKLRREVAKGAQWACKLGVGRRGEKGNKNGEE